MKTFDSIKFWTDDQFMSAIQYEEDNMWYAYLVISYLTGMRKGEIRGLKWTDINFYNNAIYINRHISDKVRKSDRENNIDKRVIHGRKNGSSHIVAMDNNIKLILQDLMESYQSIDGWNKNTYVFGIYKPVGQNSPKRHLDEIAVKAGLPPITIHGLRHSHVSYLISKGLNAYEIAERIGDTVEMVLKVYGHMFPNPQKNIVAVLNDNFNFNNNKEKEAIEDIELEM